MKLLSASLPRMDDEAAAKAKKTTSIEAMSFRATPLQVLVALFAVFLLLWIIHLGFRVATETETEISHISNWGFQIGVVTLLFGVLFVALGLPIVVNLFLKLSEKLQKHEEIGFYSGELMPIRTVIGRMFVTLITMVMLAWTSYTGFRLTTEPRRDDKYYPLIFPIGIVTILFGSVYIIIGLAIIADLVLSLVVQFMLKQKKGIIVHEGNNTDAKTFV